MKKIACLILLALGVSAFFSIAATARQQPAKEKNAALQTQAQPEKIIPAAKNIREKTAIYVFVAWLWAAIFVLIYIVRLEIKEADRLLDLKFFHEDKK
jgi:hypothetical protein